MYDVFEIAKFFLSKTDEEAGDVISNLKLQKLLYYAQGFTLAMTGEPLFKQRIEAWLHGPVVPEVYRAFKEHGNAGIPPQGEPEIDKATKELLDDVYSVYGQFSAWKLRQMTHDEPPWKSVDTNDDISHASLKEYFSTQIE